MSRQHVSVARCARGRRCRRPRSPPFAAFAAWEPTKPVEFVVPAGTGGGADQMARFLQGVVAKHNLMKQPLVVVNKSGGAGAEGFLEVKGAQGRPAQDHHHAVQPVHDAARHRRAVQLEGPDAGRDARARRVRAVGQRGVAVQDRRRTTSTRSRPATTGKFKMAGTGSKQEDQIITVALEKAVGKKLTYVPFKGGGDVAVQLVGKHVDSTVNNPIEAIAHWRSRRAAAAVRVRQQADALPDEGDGDACRGRTSRPASRQGSTSSTRCCAASSCRPA